MIADYHSGTIETVSEDTFPAVREATPAATDEREATPASTGQQEAEGYDPWTGAPLPPPAPPIRQDPDGSRLQSAWNPSPPSGQGSQGSQPTLTPGGRPNIPRKTARRGRSRVAGVRDDQTLELASIQEHGLDWDLASIACDDLVADGPDGADEHIEKARSAKTAPRPVAPSRLSRGDEDEGED